MSRITEHKNAHHSDANMHEVKGFPSAPVGFSTRKSINGQSEFLRDSKRPNSIASINGYDSPTTENEGDTYTVTAPELDINGIVWQSGTTVRFTFSAGYTDIYALGNYFQVSGAANSKHNGVFLITGKSSTTLDVTISLVTDATDDVASSSPALGYVTHEDYDPENLANGQSIPRIGQVRYYLNSDLWFGNAFIPGDEFFDVATDGVKLVNNSGGFQSGFSSSTKKEIQIGDWNMDTGDSVVPTHGLSATEWKTIRDFSAVIRNDFDTAMYGVSSSLDVSEVYLSSISSSSFTLTRKKTGFFDSIVFDSTSYNRGWITFSYTPD